jgi:hypothetical protein
MDDDISVIGRASVCGSRKSTESENRSLKFLQKLLVIFESAVLNIIELRVGVTYVSVGTVVFYLAFKIYRIALSEIFKFVN